MSGQAFEDYLKATLALSDARDRVSTSALAHHLRVKPSSVTAMLKRLTKERPRLVEYRSHQGVRLTEDGRLIALNVVRRHRLIEQFLVTALGYGWDQVHAEAHRLEHWVSPMFVERIDKFLEYPPFDPHGRPIPSKDGHVSAPTEFPLSNVEVGEVVRVSSVRSEKTEFLQYLTSIGLSLNVLVRVLEAPLAGGVIRIEIAADGDKAEHVISELVATKIYVCRQD